MLVLSRILAVYLVLTAFAVFFNLILTPLYHDGSSDYPVWQILNWFMAVAVVLSLIVNFRRRFAIGDWRYTDIENLLVSTTYFAAIALAMLFFWGWLWTLNPDSETGDAVTSHLIYFPLVDTIFVIVSLSTGRYLWNTADAGN